MHRVYYHNDDESVTCRVCSVDSLVFAQDCPEATKYLAADTRLLDLIDEWHDGNGLGQSLVEYLGWTEKEYAHWINSFELPERFVEQ